MKKINLRRFKITSPRKERGVTSPDGCDRDPGPNSPKSFDSQDESYSTPDIVRHASSDSGSRSTPKKKNRKSIFTTFKKKLTPSKHREIEEESAHPWHDGYRGISSGMDGECAINSRSWKSVPRHVQKPVRPARSEERLVDLGSPPIPTRDALYQTRSVHRAQYHRTHDDVHSSREQSSVSKSEDESDKEEISSAETKEKPGVPFPFDTEYGHASAPFNNEPNGASGEDIIEPILDVLPCSRPSQTFSRSAQPSSSSHPEGFEAFDLDVPSNLGAGLLLGIPPVYDQVKDPPKMWSLTKELFKLSKYGWYWGPITRVEAEEKLSSQPDGGFLVRDSSDERYLLSLSFRSYGRTLHTRIEHCNGVFSFYAQPESEGYSSIVDLIEHSMNDSQTGVFCYSRARTPGSPSFPVRLTKPVSRFTQVRTLQYLCRFVIRQYTRFDHIQKLPLPTSIKGWLEENQY